MNTNDFVREGGVTFRRFYLLPMCGFVNYYIDICINSSNPSIIEIFFRNVDTKKSVYFILEFDEHKLENLRLVKKDETSLLVGTTSLLMFYGEQGSKDGLGKLSILGSPTTERLLLSIELLKKESNSQVAEKITLNIQDFLSIKESDHFVSEVTNALNEELRGIPFTASKISSAFQGALMYEK